MLEIDNRSQVNVARMEHQILHHVKQALRVTLNWLGRVSSQAL